MRALVIAGLALFWIGQSNVAQTNNCIVCHSEIRVDYLESAHAPAGVTCVDCHGGDPATLDYRAAHAGSTTPTRAQIPQLCASCHADPVKMKPYGLRTDQYAEYLTSGHGKAFAAGDLNAAICTDCHTSHRVMSRFEPRSSVHPQHLAQTCARCHADSELMKPYGLSTDIVDNFRQGVHGTALQNGNPRAPTCATCHGLHGSTLLQPEDIVTVCGTCHIAERQYFDKSVHRSKTNSAEFQGCAACHGDHRILSAQSSLFESVCTQCHSNGTSAHALGEKLKTLLTEVQRALHEAELVLQQAEGMAFDVSGYRSRLHEAQTHFLQARAAQHVLDEAQLVELTRRAQAIANDIRGEAHSLQTAVQIRWLGLTLVWGYLVLVLIVLSLYRQAYRRERSL
ncbi:MAG: cytochrome c3 family protein [Candidatus Bipolaricaulota bacterium]|nr:cytochrome c3 family protein [Candidatus Bipolaricaulota bacterium]MCS7274998.1 cytochrome c3 family protein [Candidatus Bipolaricaulota bacterium]MDW8110537.1 cytochrome c3 family protein [Candidatus Bipolaricaulota bacterium]MDW8329312.1 cytochrome c3 family protein [Candidatus Bipolaricaulota bacterium]